MKRSILTLFVLMQSLCLFAETVLVNGVYYNLIEKGNIAEVTSNPQGYSGDIVIQESVSYNNKNYSVVGIGENAFRNCSITSIFIPSGIREIKSGAFSSSEQFKAVKISNLESWLKITLNENPLMFAKHLFINGIEATEIVIPESITELKDNVFHGCSSIKSVTIPSSVVSIGARAFQDCINLKQISIPNSVTDIGASAFSGCTGLESASLPNGLKYILSYLFEGCNSLKYINISSSVETIMQSVFNNCSALESIELPDNLKVIGMDAFRGCSKLTSIIIPNKVEEISFETFQGCNKLKTITIGKSVRHIFSYNFNNCSELENVYCYTENVPYVEDYVFQGSYIEATVLHVPDSLIEKYKTANVWKDFGIIIAIDNESGEKPQCAKPTINYNNGQLIFTTTTDGAEFISEIKDADIGNHYDATISLKATYNISVYATKSGYSNSETVRATLCWIDAEPKTEGVTNAIANVRANPVLIQSEGNVLSISGVDVGTPIRVFDVSGKQVGLATVASESTYINTNLTKGQIGIVQIGETRVKIILR